MSTPLRLLLSGYAGRLCRAIDRLATESGDFVVVGGIDVAPSAPAGVPVWQNAAACDVAYDVLIDASHPNAIPDLLSLTERTGRPLMVCTTGLDAGQIERLRAFADHHAVFQSANLSLGVNLLVHLVRHASAALYPGFDMEIVEAHHNRKIDAPSGTALMIATAAQEARERVSGTPGTFTYDRHASRSPRDQREIGIHSVRGGSIVGEHEVIYAGQDEVIRLSHQAASRDVFARGALAAARFMAHRTRGWYTMDDLVRG